MKTSVKGVNDNDDDNNNNNERSGLTTDTSILRKDCNFAQPMQLVIRLLSHCQLHNMKPQHMWFVRM